MDCPFLLGVEKQEAATPQGNVQKEKKKHDERTMKKKKMFVIECPSSRGWGTWRPCSPVGSMLGSGTLARVSEDFTRHTGLLRQHKKKKAC